MQHWVRFSAKFAAGILSAWFLLLPVTANALGLGNIKMDSALNEPLMARIQLLSANSDDIKGLNVKLASREAFMRAGVDRTQLLSKIKFNIVKKGGKYYVVLTTAQSIREPFLNFLVELNWKNGRMLREYTVLLDPARTAGQQETAQAPETTPPVSQTAAATPTPAPVPTSPFAGGDEPSQPIAAPAPSPAPTTTTTAKAEQPESPLLPAGPINETSPKTAKQETPAPAPAPAPSEAAAPAPAPAAVPEQPFEAKSQDSGVLFPAIPLTAYKETGPTGPAATTSKQAAAPEPAMPSTGGELDYGITKKGDNLWDIAEKLKPNNQVTIYQVMMALQKSNPKAFVNGNIHRLKVGQVMRIADPSLLSAMSKAQARKQYQAQTQDWQNYLASRGNKVPRQVINAGEQTQASTSSGVPSGQLTLSTPQSQKMGAGTGSSETESTNSSDVALLEQQARKAMQEAKTQRKKNAELMKKLDGLNAELNRMQNLVNVKDSDLARLQHKLDELNKQRADSGSQTTTASADIQAPTAPKPEASTTPPATATPPAPAPAQPAAASVPAEQPAETAQAKPEQSATPAAPQQPAQAEKTAPKPATPAVPSSPAPTTTTKASGGIMGTIKGFFGGVMGGLNAMMLIIGGVIIVVILLLIFILVRRRKGANFQESILTGGSAGEDPMTMDGNPSQGSSLMGGESSFLSDFAISGVSAIQAEDSEVDPLTEADVFMAYGRYEAAEERLQEAINQDPDRGELRVKLLELFNTTKNKQAFESTAEDFYAALGSNAAGNPLWQKVLNMGRELAPENPLFSGGVAAPSAAAEPAAPSSAPDLSDKQDVMDIGLDTGVFNTSDFSTDAFNEPSASQAGEVAIADEAENADNMLDFNLDMDQPSTPASSAETESSEDMGLDFSLDMDSSTSSPEAEPALDFNLDSLPADDTAGGGLDFNLDTGGEASAETPATHDDLDLNLNLDEGNEPTATDIKLGMEDEDASAAGLDFDFSESTAGGGNGAGGTDMNLDASDTSMSLDMSGGGDEVGTKLDLARAYIDMGDPDGARSILDEVLEEGNDGQKQEAQQLMTQIG
ncbi:MAG: FimV/HubP family polar landmark protein [Gammaproteobacteria bacterium]